VSRINVPEWPWRAVHGLAEERSIRLWLVGGAVRDIVMRRPVHDWDFAVDRSVLALARSVGDALGGFFFPLDEERGTARVVLKTREESGLVLDFARLRGPSLEADLAGRDFTINAMAVADGGELVDPLGGKADLDAGRIRVTHRQALSDDPVRLLRAARLEAELDFHTEVQTEAWIREYAPLLAEPAPERVRDELVRGLAVPDPAGFVRRVDDLKLLVHIVPDLVALKGIVQSPPHRFDVWEHTLCVVETLDGIVATLTGLPLRSRSPERAGVPAGAWGALIRRLGQFGGVIEEHLAATVCDRRDRLLLLRLGALFHDIGKPQTQSKGNEQRIHFYGHESEGARAAASRMRALRFSRDEVLRVRTVVQAHLRPAQLARENSVTRRAIYRYFRDTGDVGVDAVLLSLADHLATWGPELRGKRWARRLDAAELLLYHYFERPEQTVHPQVPVDGHDLIDALGLKPGPEVGRLLDLLREAVAAGEVETRQEALDLARKSAE